MKKLIGFGLLMIASASFALAGQVSAPEIDAQSGAAALALLGGGLMVLRSRRAKR